MKRKKSALIMRVVVILGVIGLIAIFFIFRDRMNYTLNYTTETYLQENVDALATTFFTKLDDQMVMLESQTRYFQDIDLTDYNLMKNTIISTKGIGAFKSIGVASASGATMDYNGKSAGNIMLTDYFKEAMQGENAISEPTRGGSDSEVLVLAVPIKKKSDVVGIIYGTFDSEVLNSLVGSVRFAENAANLLVTDDGDIIARTTDTPWVSEKATNLFDEIPGLEVTSGKDDLYYKYTKDGKSNILVLTTVGVHDWYFATVIPEEQVTVQNRVVERYVIYVIAGVSLIFLAWMFVIYLVNRTNREVEEANEKLMAVSEQTADIIIDYDYKTRRLTMDGDVTNILPKKKDYYGDDEVAELFERIHAEDEDLYEELKHISKSKKKLISREGRLQLLDQRYRWYQVNLTVISDNDGNATRLIGSLSDVDEKMNKELNLVHKAETDQLTGITNKMAFEESVQRVIEGLKEEQGLALFIMDLDNFKKVNDTLGHIVGDRVLAEVARKLQIVFPNQHTLGRIGGDEFAAYLLFDVNDESSLDKVTSRAESVCKSLKMTYSGMSSDESITISASVGIAMYPKDGDDYKEIYMLADQALYRSKHDGKSRYTVWSRSFEWEDDE